MKNVVHLREMINSSLIDISFCTLFLHLKGNPRTMPQKDGWNLEPIYMKFTEWYIAKEIIHEKNWMKLCVPMHNR